MCRRPIAGLVTANRIPLGSLSGRRHRPASPFRVHLRRPNPRSRHSATPQRGPFQPIRAPLGMLSLYLGTLLGNATTADLAENTAPGGCRRATSGAAHDRQMPPALLDDPRPIAQHDFGVRPALQRPPGRSQPRPDSRRRRPICSIRVSPVASSQRSMVRDYRTHWGPPQPRSWEVEINRLPNVFHKAGIVDVNAVNAARL